GVHVAHTARESLPPGTYQADVSHDFELYAFTTKQGACFVRRVSDDVEIASLPELGESVTPIFGPGRLLALYQDQRSRLCQLWDLAEPKPILRINERSILGCGFRPDGRLLVLRHGDKNGDFFSVRATGTGLCERRLPPDGNRGRAYVAPHPTEPVVAIGSF